MEILRQTKSVCPVCLRPLPARLVRQEDECIFLERQCPDHGLHRALVWQGKVSFEDWTQSVSGLEDEHCSGDCTSCTSHPKGSCCALLEVTRRCNLRCTFCFAQGGSPEEDPSREEMEQAIRQIGQLGKFPLLQFSGGEPTLREDLPELIRYAKNLGFRYTQVNTNGLRLAREPGYARVLKEAGLDIVFLQFDGTRNDIYETLRGAPLLDEKLAAIRACGAAGLGVTLVPTVVRGVNTDDLGNLLALAKGLVPTVRGIHFQPVSYFGRYPDGPLSRYTLDELMADLAGQTGLPMDAFLPSKCDHPLCGFHASFLVKPDGNLKVLSSFQNTQQRRLPPTANRDYVGRHWTAGTGDVPEYAEEMDFDDFLQYLKTRSLTISSMAFQDAGNLNLERLKQCSLHVYREGKLLPFCANYLTPMT